jgi:hypothetical protein
MMPAHGGDAERHGPLGTIAAVAEFLVGLVAGLSIAGLLWIVVAPSRRARAETGIDPDVEAALLLGGKPEDDAEATDASPSAPEHDRPYGPEELQALRKLGSAPRRRRRA